MRNILLLGLSLLAGLLLGEGLLRLALDEVDYLRPSLMPHPVLRHAIEPGSGGHDAWGFRNNEVPKDVDIVAIGDSMTYGNSAMAKESWPAWLAELSGKTVYNMGLGGHGPPDYLYLLKANAFRLSPETVIVGLFLGNDLLRSYEDATGQLSASVTFENRKRGISLDGLRGWLSQNSMTYQVIKHTLPTLVGRLRHYQDRVAPKEGELLFETPRLRTVFETSKRLRVLDQSLAQNRIGLSRMLEIAAEIDSEAKAHSVGCLTLIIPTQESVYWHLARDVLSPKDRAQLEQVVLQETLVRNRILAFLEREGIRFVDLLPPLRQAANHTVLYPERADGHPLGSGYRVIAVEVQRRLLELGLLQ